MVKESGMRGRRKHALIDHAAPRYVACINELDLGQEAPTHHRANTVGPDQQITAEIFTVGEPRCDPMDILLEIVQSNPSNYPLLRKDVAQHRMEPPPGGAELGHLDLGSSRTVSS
jgi:hypothetical protein